MKLWIARERLRLFSWEMYYSLAYDFKELKEELHEYIYNPGPYHPIEIEEHRKRNYQCVDFCQCEFGCPNLVRVELPAVKK